MALYEIVSAPCALLNEDGSTTVYQRPGSVVDLSVETAAAVEFGELRELRDAQAEESSPEDGDQPAAGSGDQAPVADGRPVTVVPQEGESLEPKPRATRGGRRGADGQD